MKKVRAGVIAVTLAGAAVAATALFIVNGSANAAERVRVDPPAVRYPIAAGQGGVEGYLGVGVIAGDSTYIPLEVTFTTSNQVRMLHSRAVRSFPRTGPAPIDFNVPTIPCVELGPNYYRCRVDSKSSGDLFAGVVFTMAAPTPLTEAPAAIGVVTTVQDMQGNNHAASSEHLIFSYLNNPSGTVVVN